MKYEPVKDHAERKRISALIEQCEKEQTMRDITLMPNDYIVTHIKTDTICEHFSNDDVVYAVEERIIPLVRCKECKYCVDVGAQRALVCDNSHIDMDIHPDDFCSYAERRTDD